MSNIVISGVQLCGNISGIPRYVYEVVTRLDKLFVHFDFNYDVEICYPSNLSFVDYDFQRIKVVPLDTHGKKWMSQVIKNYVISKNAVLVDFSGSGFAKNRNELILIHDVRPLVRKYDDLRTVVSMVIRMVYYKLYNARIFTVSYDQKKALERYFPKQKVEVISPGWEHILRFKEDDTIFDKYPQIVKGQYYYLIGSPAKHKNYIWVVENAKKNPDKQFVIAGTVKKDHELYGALSSISNIVLVNYISDGEHKSLLQHCLAFINCSLYEGFGLTPLEALCLKKTIIVSDLAVSHEVYGDNAIYIDPYDYSYDFSDCIEVSSEGRNALLSKYSWDKSAEKWFIILKDIITKGSL